MATIDLGKVAFVWKGTYNSGTTYEEKDVVQYTDNGELSSYVYVNASSASGQTPSTGGTVNTTYWSKMAGGTTLSVGNSKVVITDSSGNISGQALGSAGQFLRTNASANGFEFATVISKVRNIGSQTYTNRITSLADSPSGSNGYGGTATIFGSSAFSYTKQSATSYLLVQLGISGAGGGHSHHGRGTISISTDGSSISNAYVCGSSFPDYVGNNWGYWNWKILNNASAQSYNIDFRYGGNGSEFWETINPNGSDHNEWSCATSCEMTVFEIEN
jgi:hypothetical protein